MEKEIVYEGKWVSMVRVGTWEYASRVKGTGAVIIPTLTLDNECVFVEQYRIPVECNTIEWPAGMIGDEEPDSDEHFTIAATRELFEETGYYPGRTFADPHKYCATAGAVDEMLNYVVCTHCEKRGQGGGVDNENIIVHTVPFAEVDEWLVWQQEQGKIVDAKVNAGLYRILKALKELDTKRLLKNQK